MREKMYECPLCGKKVSKKEGMPCEACIAYEEARFEGISEDYYWLDE